MLIAQVVLVGLLLSAEDVELAEVADRPARGSMNGPWAFAELSFFSSSVLPADFDVPPTMLGGDVAIVGGFGFELGGVRLSPTMRFSIGPRTPVGGRLFFDWSPLAFGLAAPDLINDTKTTGLRFTPLIGATFPLKPEAYADGAVPITTVHVAGQLERRFGAVEFAYRPTASTTRCQRAEPGRGQPTSLPCLSTWALSNRLFAESWFEGAVSLAVGLDWTMQWLEVSPTMVTPTVCIGFNCEIVAGRAPNHIITLQTLFTWAFSDRFGTTIELEVGHLPTGVLTSGTWTTVEGSISLWFRTDGQLQRNWLDR